MLYSLLPLLGWPVKLKVMAFAAYSCAFQLAGHQCHIIQSFATKGRQVGPGQVWACRPSRIFQERQPGTFPVLISFPCS